MKTLIYLCGFCVVLSTDMLHAQERFEPLISVGHSRCLYPFFESREYELMGGVHLNNHTSVQLFFRGIDRAGYTIPFEPYNPSQHKMLIIGLQSSYRFIDYLISPVLSINGGSIFYSNARGNFVDGGLAIVNHKTDLIYKYGTFAGKAKLLLDFKLNAFNFQIGRNFNYYLINVFNVTTYNDSYKISSIGYHHLFSMGFEANLVYTFGSVKMKNVQAK